MFPLIKLAKKLKEPVYVRDVHVEIFVSIN